MIDCGGDVALIVLGATDVAAVAPAIWRSVRPLMFDRAPVWRSEGKEESGHRTFCWAAGESELGVNECGRV